MCPSTTLDQMSDNLGRSYIGSVVLGLALAGGAGLCLYLLMRKEEDWEGVTSKQVSLEMKIPKDSVGIVIGRQGSNIKEIMEKTGTRINFRDELETDQFRVACIKGLPDDAQMAEILIHKTISQQPRQETLTIFVPERVVGMIIGRGGDNVREIQRVSRCMVDIDRGALGEGMEKKIVLKGTSEEINMAKELIEDIVKEEAMMWAGGCCGPPRIISSSRPAIVDISSDAEEVALEDEKNVLKTEVQDNCLEVLDKVESSEVPLNASPYAADQLPMRNIFDSHCHIDFILDRKLRHPAIRTYSRLVEKYPALHHQKLEGFITNYCDPSTWPELGTAPPAMLSSAWVTQGLSVNYTVGCHPHFAEQLLREGAMEALERLLVEGRGRGCVAVGECGLDCSRKNGADMDIQIEAFKLQVKLALKLDLPLVLHIRDAEEEGIAVLESCGLPGTWPVHRHCWNDSWVKCQAWLDLFPGSVVGMTGLVTYRQAEQAREVARLLPLDRLVLETDAPYFRPQYSGVLPRDGLKFAHPVQVASVAALIAEVRGVSFEEVLARCRENVARVYRIPVTGQRREAVTFVEDIIEDLINSVTDDVKTEADHTQLKRLSDADSGGQRKKLKTVVEHLITQDLNCKAGPFTPGDAVHSVLPAGEVWGKSGQGVQELTSYCGQSQQEEFSLRMVGYEVPCEVHVSALCSPGQFWVQKIGPMSVDLDQLVQQMTKYYSDGANQKCHTMTSVELGDIVVCRFGTEDSYFRARVVELKESCGYGSLSSVDVHFVDYGDNQLKSIKEIYKPRAEFLKLKFQAIHCSLAHIRPETGEDWSEDACDKFEMMTGCDRGKVLWAMVVGYQPRGVPWVELVDTGRRQTSLGQELVRIGVARWVETEK